VDLNYTGLNPVTNITSSNAVYGNQVVGVVIGTAGTTAYQATVNTSFQLSNVISANGANGITLHQSNDNRIAMNNIGTNVVGTADLGNAQNGILIKKSSAGNLIGGEATGGNDPTANVFVRPPQGNLISGNDANGVLINSKATANQLSGNFIGTTASGLTALGNSLDGVAIDKADGNSLIGCTFQQDPFVFYNVISGNGGNGLSVNNADDTTIQANFFGLGSDNLTRVGNTLNGVLVEGNSTRTVMGGPIPLGNVDAANGQNGIVVQDKASFFTTYNTFCGLAAFRDDANLGNGQDGMFITSTGGNNLIRTNVIASNGDDGIEISGKAKDVRVAGNIIGLNTQGLIPMGNADNGVEIGGKAHDNFIGGPQPTFNIIPRNAIASNGGNGVAILGTAHDNTVSHSYIGLDLSGQDARGNTNDGVLLGSGTHDNTIGSADSSLLTVISGNTGNGIELNDTHDNTVIGSYVGLRCRRHDRSRKRCERHPHHRRQFQECDREHHRRPTEPHCQQHRQWRARRLGHWQRHPSEFDLHQHAARDPPVDRREFESGGARADLGPSSLRTTANYRHTHQPAEEGVHRRVLRQHRERGGRTLFPRHSTSHHRRDRRCGLHLLRYAPAIGRQFHHSDSH